jgi:serine/threonine protein kinase
MLANNPVNQALSDQFINQALANNSDYNCSCAIVEIVNLPNHSLDDYNTELTRLPFPPPLEPGMKLDGYLIKKEIFASSRSQLYEVQDLDTGENLVMKTPSVNFLVDTGYIDRFIQEEWIGKRIQSPHVVRIVRQKRARTFLYYLMDHVQGVSLDVWMKNNRLAEPKLAINIIEQIAEGLRAFHIKETIHQDLKPANILIDDDHQITIFVMSCLLANCLMATKYPSAKQPLNMPACATNARQTITQSSPFGLTVR